MIIRKSIKINAHFHNKTHVLILTDTLTPYLIYFILLSSLHHMHVETIIQIMYNETCTVMDYC